MIFLEDILIGIIYNRIIKSGKIKIGIKYADPGNSCIIIFDESKLEDPIIKKPLKNRNWNLFNFIVSPTI